MPAVSGQTSWTACGRRRWNHPDQVTVCRSPSSVRGFDGDRDPRQRGLDELPRSVEPVSGGDALDHGVQDPVHEIRRQPRHHQLRVPGAMAEPHRVRERGLVVAVARADEIDLPAVLAHRLHARPLEIVVQWPRLAQPAPAATHRLTGLPFDVNGQ
jgi:hypothetical protein